MSTSPQRAQSNTEASVNRITEAIIGAAMKVHSALGPGLLESAYEACMVHELRKAGLKVVNQVVLPVHYDGIDLELGYRLDLLVEDRVIVELKCVEKILPVHEAQLISYLRLSGKRVGLLINFHVRSLKDGIKRWKEQIGGKYPINKYPLNSYPLIGAFMLLRPIFDDLILTVHNLKG